MPQPTPDQVQIANEVLAGARQITGSSAVEETDAKEAAEAERQSAIDVSIAEQQASAMDAYYGSTSPPPEAPAIEPPPEPTPAVEVSPEPG